MEGRRHSVEAEDHGIDLAPMLDFVLNLLIFFIITTSFVKDPGVTVARPDARSAVAHEAGNILIAVRANGDVWLDRRRIEPRDLRAELERMHAERPEDSVVVLADRDSSAGRVAEVMDRVRLAGIRDLSLAAAAPAKQ